MTEKPVVNGAGSQPVSELANFIVKGVAGGHFVARIMSRILSDSNTGIPKKYITKSGSYKIIEKGNGEYFMRCPHKDCRAEVDLRELSKFVGLTSLGEACPVCGQKL